MSPQSGLNSPRIRIRLRTPPPSVCAEERSFKWSRARDCLSEASASGTPLEASTAGCPQRSGGTQTAGSPFFGLPYFGEAKKGESPAAATERHQDLATNLVFDSSKRRRQVRPDPSIPQDERGKASTGSARTGTGTDSGFGIGRFRGQSTNSPRLWLALRVLRFASQRNCDLTPKTKIQRKASTGSARTGRGNDPTPKT